MFLPVSNNSKVTLPPPPRIQDSPQLGPTGSVLSTQEVTNPHHHGPISIKTEIRGRHTAGVYLMLDE